MHSPAQFIATVLGIVGAILFLIGVNVIEIGDFNEFQQQSFGVIGGLILTLAAAVVSLRYPVDIWWFNKYPPRLESELIILLERIFPFYTRLNLSEKKRFVKELTIFLLKTDVELMNEESVPSDVETFVAAVATQLTFYKEDEVFSLLEKIIFYPVPFPTLKNRQLHTGEFHEDGVVILSLKEFTDGLMLPKEHFNIGLYTFACSFIHYSNMSPLHLKEEDLREIELIRGFTIEDVTNTHNIHNFNIEAFLIETYFECKILFQQRMPSIFQAIESELIDSNSDFKN